MPKNPTPPLSETLQAAATLLEMEAASLKDCHTVRGRWSNHDFGAREAHDEMTRVAKALRLAHKHMQPNPLGGPARVFDAIADSIRAGDSVQLAMRAFGVKWAKRSNAALTGAEGVRVEGTVRGLATPKKGQI